MLEAFAIVLSIVSLIITVVGFFASLRFYRDGVQLQQAANHALTKLEEKIQFIQTQVGSMFDKTLDAAIGKREILSNRFEELNEQLEKTKAKLIQESVGQIGAAGENERHRITNLVNEQIALLQTKVEDTRESAQEIVDESDPHQIRSYLSHAIVSLLNGFPDGLTIRELQDRLRNEKNVNVTLAALWVQLGLMEKSGAIARKANKVVLPFEH